MDHQKTLSPHVLMFPLPLQGPVNSMLKLAELLCLADFHVTFLNTNHIQNRLSRYTDIESRFSGYPKFRFETVSDGLSDDSPRSADRFIEMFLSMEAVTFPLVTEMVASGPLSCNSERPVTCIIADGILSFAVDVGIEVGIPIIYFETISPCALWTYLCIPKLTETGQFPFKGDDLDAKLTCVPGMEGFLRQRDLPSFCRASELIDSTIQLQLVLKQVQKFPKAQGLILNTFEELEGHLLSHISTVCPNLYAIGPIHAHLKARLSLSPKLKPKHSLSNSLWEEDKSCMAWLDAQPKKSVIYFSVGSNTVITRDQLMEFWHGLVNSGKRFLWVRRPESVSGGESMKGQIPAELLEGTKERGCIVGWAPQEEVLGHPAIGGFLTHNGWNSTLESITEGVPMIGWPHFVDQQVNSRFVGEVWKVGLDMKDTCDRVIIEKMVRELMDERKGEFEESAKHLSKLARESVGEGGSSYCNLERLIEDIGSWSLHTLKS
ncbi:unnamed protein product [Ilex paraguariensis]|uniref:Glycosyltransferase n=1 Tax=Ilex paraguariensis TaxID=185542 RepID=A0ABC8V113_9AQUA